MKKLFLTCVATIAGFQSGCMSPNRVPENPTEEKLAYLVNNFAISSIDSSLINAVTSQDSIPIKFKKMTYSIIYDSRAALGIPDISGISIPTQSTISHGVPDSRVTLVQAPAPFVMELIENFKDGIPVYDTYSLTYRDITSFKTQGIDPHGKPESPLVTRKIREFPSLNIHSTDADQLIFDTEFANSPQSDAKLWPAKPICVLGRIFDASIINKKFTGKARALDCTLYGVNGKASSQQRRAYLLQYGVTIEIQSLRQGDLMTGHIFNVHVE